MDKHILRVGKYLDYKNTNNFRDKVSDIKIIYDSIIYVDFENTITIDSSGISYLINLYNIVKKNNNRVIFVNLSDSLFKIMKLVNLNKLFPMFKSMEIAMAEVENIKHLHSKDVTLYLIHNNIFILEILNYMLNANSYNNIRSFISVQDFLKKNSSQKFEDGVLILSSDNIIDLPENEILNLKKTNINILLTNIYSILEQENFEEKELEVSIQEIFKSLDNTRINDIILENNIKNRSGNPEDDSKELREYISDFIHDISSPMNIFLNSSVFIDDVSNLDPEIYKAFEISVKKLNLLIDELSIYNQKHSDINFEKINVFEFLNELVSMFKSLADFENKNIEIQIPEDIKDLYVLSSREYLYHLMINLISNGIKYSDKNVGFFVEVENDKLCVKVYDDGKSLDKFAYLNSNGINYRNIHNTYKKGTGRGIKIITKIISALGLDFEIENTRNGKFLIVRFVLAENE